MGEALRLPHSSVKEAKMFQKILFWGLAFLFILGVKDLSYGSGASHPSMSSSGGDGGQTLSLYDQGMQATGQGDFKYALSLFQQALQDDPQNPDILNMLAHSQRMVGKIDEAIVTYKKALELRPDFPQAQEYLGEAYLQAAQRQLEILQNDGDEGKEQWGILAGALKDAAKGLPDKK